MTFNLNKPILCVILFLSSVIYGVSNAQTISFLKDTTKLITIETVNDLQFKPYNTTINDGTNYANYWIKIEGLNNENYSVQIPNSRITEVQAFKNNTFLKHQACERFSTFFVSGTEPVFIKVKTTKESYIPVSVNLVNDYYRNEKSNFLFIGFYIGFVILIVSLNILYSLNFNDRTYTYYGLFLLSSSIGILISDGLFTFLHFSNKTIDILETLINITIGGFAILFMNRFLQLHHYFSKFKFIPFSLLLASILTAFLFLITENFHYYIATEVLVFLSLLPYWVGALLLFKKNNFMKITVFAYSIILIFSMDFYLTKLFGIDLMHSTQNQLKIGSIFEMVVLSLAVIYRMKTINIKNKEMRSALDSYTKELKTLSAKIKEDKSKTTENVHLSFRETEIIELISLGKTNKEIANTLSISENTVKYHIKNIYTKLNIKSRKEILRLVK